MNKKILVLLPALALLLAGCQKGGNSSVSPSAGPVDSGSGISDTSASESGVTGVEIDHESLELQVGQTVKLAASVKPISLDDREVEWSSDNAEVASVDASGMVTAVATGSAKIKASAHADPTKFAECPVTVTGRKVTIAKLTAAEAMAATEELKFGANQKNAGGYYFFKGTVDGNTRGETTQSWAEGVNVKLEQVPSTTDKYYVTFQVENAKKYFEMDDVHHFAIVDTPTAGREWAWNETYATVQRTISGQTDNKNNGTFLPGTYQTYTTISGCNLEQAASDFFFQFVYQTDPVAPTGITIKAADTKIYQGGTLQMEAELAPAAAEGKVVWSVTGDEKVTIDQTGLLTAANDATLNAKVTVKAAYDKDASVFGTLEITVAEIINYGTLENPLTVAEAKAVIDKFTAGTLTGEKMFVKGFVGTSHALMNSTDKRGNVWLTNDDGSVQKEFEFYSALADASLGEIAADSLIGKEVIGTGWGTNYNGTYEFSNKNAAGEYDNPIVKKITTNTRAATSITLTPAEAFEIEQGSDKAVSATLMPYGASGTVAFAVAPANQGVSYENGKVVATATATAGSYTLTATCGSLTQSVAFTVKAASSSSTDPVTVKKTVAELKADNSWTNGGVVNSLTLGKVDVTLTGDSGDTKYYDSGSNLRIYLKAQGSGSVAFAAKSGFTIVSIKITYVWNKSTGTFPLASDAVDTVNAASKSYAIGNPVDSTEQLRITAFEIVYKAA